MKLSIMKKITSITMVSVITFSTFTGCNTSSTSNNNTTPSTAPASEGTQDATGNPADLAFEKYDPPIDVTFVRCIDNDLATNILPKTPGETIDNNRWTQLYSESLGVNIKYLWTVNGGYTEDAYKQKINITLASGDLPDVIPVNRQQLKQLAESDMIEDLTPYYEKYASDFTKSIMTHSGTAMLDSASIDGKIMGMPNADPDIESVQYLWIRTDWLKKLNLEPPKTMDELLKISEAFTTQDPDGNGANDTYGLAITKELYAGCMGTEGFFAGYGAFPNFWTTGEDGKLAYGSVQPQVKDALKSLSEMYKNGQLDKEFGVKDGGKVAEAIAAGKIGINFGEQWNSMYPLIMNIRNDKEADWQAYELVSANDKPVIVPMKFRNDLYFVVKKGYEHPEALIKLFNKHLDQNWGPNNQFGKYYMPVENESKGVWKFSPVSPAPQQKNLDAFIAIQEARKTNTLDALEGEAKTISDNIETYHKGETELWGWEKIYGVDGAFKNLEAYMQNNQLIHESFVGAPTDTMTEKRSTLEKMEKEVFIKIIMGAAPLDDFDKFVSDWNKLGGEQITKEVNEWKEIQDK